MQLNADFTRRAVVHGADEPWVPSPTPGVERRMLDRVGGEVARATSIVRYAPGSRFPAHVHGGGEEFLVLEGVFSDESGDMPVGTYVRNPPGTSHAPGSEPGCTILVKLWQFATDDRTGVRVDADELLRRTREDGEHPSALLHRDELEEVRIASCTPGSKVNLPLPGGGEFFVIGGGFEESGEPFRPWSWLRLPPGSSLSASVGPNGCLLWMKTGHLIHPELLQEPGE